MKDKHDVFFRLLYNRVKDSLHPIVDAHKIGKTTHMIDEHDHRYNFLERLGEIVNSHYPHLLDDFGIMSIAHYVIEFHPDSDVL